MNSTDALSPSYPSAVVTTSIFLPVRKEVIKTAIKNEFYGTVPIFVNHQQPSHWHSGSGHLLSNVFMQAPKGSAGRRQTYYRGWWIESGVEPGLKLLSPGCCSDIFCYRNRQFFIYRSDSCSLMESRACSVPTTSKTGKKPSRSEPRGRLPGMDGRITNIINYLTFCLFCFYLKTSPNFSGVNIWISCFSRFFRQRTVQLLPPYTNILFSHMHLVFLPPSANSRNFSSSYTISSQLKQPYEQLTGAIFSSSFSFIILGFGSYQRSCRHNLSIIFWMQISSSWWIPSSPEKHIMRLYFGWLLVWENFRIVKQPKQQQNCPMYLICLAPEKRWEYVHCVDRIIQ